MRDAEGYREALEDILRFMDGKRLMTAKDVGKYLGIDPRTAAKRFGISKSGIFATDLARMRGRR